MTPEKNKKKPTFVPRTVRVSMGWFFRCASDGRKKWSAKGTSLENLGGDLGGWCVGVGGGFGPFRDFRKRRILYCLVI